MNNFEKTSCVSVCACAHAHTHACLCGCVLAQMHNAGVGVCAYACVCVRACIPDLRPSGECRCVLGESNQMAHYVDEYLFPFCNIDLELFVDGDSGAARESILCI